MEQALSTFVRSIFVDNMIFAYYLGMCSFLAVSKNVHIAYQLYAGKLCIEGRRSFLVRSAVC